MKFLTKIFSRSKDKPDLSKSGEVSAVKQTPFYMSQEKVWLCTYSDKIKENSKAQECFGDMIRNDQYVERPDCDPEISFINKDGDKSDVFTQEVKDELHLKLHSALTVVWQSPTGRFLIERAIKENVKFEFFADENSDMGGGWSAGKNTILFLYQDYFGVDSIVSTLVHELAHMDQYYNKRRPEALRTPSVNMKYQNAIEADAFAHQMAVAVELAIGTPVYRNHDHLNYLFDYHRYWAVPVIDKLLLDDDLSKDNIAAKAAKEAFHSYYRAHRLRTYYEDNYLKETKEKNICAAATTLFPVVLFAATLSVATAPYLMWTVAPLLTRIINSGVRHQFQKAAFPKYLEKNMSLAGKPYLEGAAKMKSFKSPLFTGVSHEGMKNLRQVGYWRFLDYLFIQKYKKTPEKIESLYNSKEKFWQRMKDEKIMSKREESSYSPEKRVSRGFKDYDMLSLTDERMASVRKLQSFSRS